LTIDPGRSVARRRQVKERATRERADQVHAQHVLELVRIALPEGGARADACGVHEDVGTPSCAATASNVASIAVPVRDVELERGRAVAELARQCLRAVSVPVGQCDARPGRGEEASARASDAGCGARDERDRAMEARAEELLRRLHGRRV
jgi:hypothetical protein